MQADICSSVANVSVVQVGKIYGTKKAMFNNKQFGAMAAGSCSSVAVHNGQINITPMGEPFVETIKTWHATGKRRYRQQREVVGQNKKKWNKIKHIFGKPITKEKVKGYQPIWSANDAV